MLVPRMMLHSAQEEVGGTSPIVPEWPVVAVVGEKSFQRRACPPRVLTKVSTPDGVEKEQNERELLSTSESCRRRQPESHWKEHR